MSEYDGTPAHQVSEVMDQTDGKQLGDVNKCASVILDVFTQSGVAKGKEIPFRLLLGSDTIRTVKQKCEDTLKLVQEWEAISSSTDYTK